MEVLVTVLPAEITRDIGTVLGVVPDAGIIAEDNPKAGTGPPAGMTGPGFAAIVPGTPRVDAVCCGAVGAVGATTVAGWTAGEADRPNNLRMVILSLSRVRPRWREPEFDPATSAFTVSICDEAKSTTAPERNLPREREGVLLEDMVDC